MIFIGGDNRADVDGRRINPVGGEMFDELAEGKCQVIYAKKL